MIAWESAGATNVGRVRRTNEDAYRIDAGHGVFVVADGMGGHAAGEVASALAADSVLESLTKPANEPLHHDPDRSIIDAFAYARRRIVECSASDRRTEGMGTTLTLALLSTDGTLRVGHLGDSRLYHLRAGELDQLTEDHTWVRQEVRAGRLDPGAARTHRYAHVLTRVLAADEHTPPDILKASVEPGDTILLCSDGLHNHLDTGSLRDVLRSDDALPELVSRLVQMANERGGTDNITAVLVRIR